MSQGKKTALLSIQYWLFNSNPYNGEAAVWYCGMMINCLIDIHGMCLIGILIAVYFDSI